MSRNLNQWFKDTSQVVQSYTGDLREDAWILLGILLALGVIISVAMSLRILLRRRTRTAPSAIPPLH